MIIAVPSARSLQIVCIGLVAALSALSSTAVQAAGAVQDAQSQMSKGDYDGALKNLDHYLSGAPQDADARFTRGLVLVKLNKTPEAIKAFADLTRDYPQLPEPYNNLAVLYAQQGDYEKARDALEAALATHPSYATAHENLGDIYAALAGAAYNRALSLDQANQGVRYKLSLINQLSSLPGKTTPTAIASAARSSAPPPVEPATPSAPPASKAAAEESSLSASDTEALRAAVNGWAQAWSAQQVDTYLGYYASDFKPDGGVSLKTWQSQRRQRLTEPSHISVTVTEPEIVAAGPHTARVSFEQEYVSNTLSNKVTKVLEFKDIDGSWKIVNEGVR